MIRIIILVFMFLSIGIGVTSQTSFLDYADTQYSVKKYIPEQVINFRSTNIRFLDSKYKSVSLSKKDIEALGFDEIVSDLNANSNIEFLEISISGRAQDFPFDS